jgi:hypothetical protein
MFGMIAGFGTSTSLSMVDVPKLAIMSRLRRVLLARVG